MVLTENVEMPEPTFLYTAVKVQWARAGSGRGPAPSRSPGLGRCQTLEANSHPKECWRPAVAQLAWTDMKPAVCPVLPNICAVRITIAVCP